MFETFPASPEEYEEYRDALVTAEQLPNPPEEIWIDEQSEEEPPDDSHIDGDWTDYSHEDAEDRYLDAMYEDRHEISEYGMDGCCGDF